MAESTAPVKKEKAFQIIRRLLEQGYEAYLVGGCVRDQILGIESPDFDIASSATPEQVMSLFRRTIAVGAHFGVVLVMDGEDPFEVATFRADDRYIDGRRPETVRYVSAREDVERRDFTINGLLYDIRTGQILDYVDGRKDIHEGLIRTIGDPEKRFSEDKLRMLRAVRFASRFDFRIEEHTTAALAKLAGGITEVSWERIRDELTKMLIQKHPDHAILRLHETGLLAQIMPELVQLIGVRQPDAFHPEGDVFNHVIKMLKIMDETPSLSRNATLVYSVLLHDIGKPGTFYEASDRIRFHNHNILGKHLSRDILKRFHFSNELIDDISLCVENHMNFMNAPKMRINTLKRFIRTPTFPIEMDLHRLDCLASHGDLSTYEFLREKSLELGREKTSPPPLLSGKRLIEMGYKPGPVFKEILKAVEDQQLLEKITVSEEAEEFVRENFPNPA